MDTFLRQIKLIRDFSLTLPVNGAELVNKLSAVTIPETTLVEAIGNSGKVFVGQVDLTDISLRPKQTFGASSFIYWTRLTVKVNDIGAATRIDGEISLTKTYPLIILLFMGMFFLFAIISLIQDNDSDILILVLVMTAVIYLAFRKALGQSKDFFEKELLLLVNNSH